MKTHFPGPILRIAAAAFVVFISSGSQTFGQNTTQALQSQLNAGNVTLPAHKTYYADSLNVLHSLDLNGDTIRFSGKRKAAIKMKAKGASIQNGTIIGPSSDTASYISYKTGVSGIVIYADDCSVNKVSVRNFSLYGIVCSGAINRPSITYCTISHTAYIGFYYDSEAKTEGGTFSHNVVDRSMIPPAKIHQLAVGIRGSAAQSQIASTGWKISDNTINMPLNPTDWTAECIEIRSLANSVVAHNTIHGGSIGVSEVRSEHISIVANKFDNQQLEGIEFLDDKNSYSASNIIKHTPMGILLDGGIGSDSILMKGDSIVLKADGSFPAGNCCIRSTAGVRNLAIDDCKLLIDNPGSNAIYMVATGKISITNSVINGFARAPIAVQLINCPDDLPITGGSVSNFTKAVVYPMNTASGIKKPLVIITGTIITGVPKVVYEYITPLRSFDGEKVELH